jgi:hypothetical protein
MVVSVHALFSKSSKIGARVIASSTAHLSSDIKVPVSHTAVLINDRWVHEATGSGVHISSYDLWKIEHSEVGRVSLQSVEYQQIANKFREIQGKEYDYIGILYIAIRLLPTFLGFKMPKKNKWESSKKYFCCEVLGFLTNKYYGMSTPVQIMDDLMKTSMVK